MATASPQVHHAHVTDPGPTWEAYCAQCNDDVHFSHREVTHDLDVRGTRIQVALSAYVCPHCDHVRSHPQHDPLEAAYREYRQIHDLLQPEEVLAIRERYQLSQDAFAKLLGMSPATIARYETGSLQDEAHDHLLRACRRPDYIRELFQQHGDRLSDLQRRRLEEALEKLGCPRPIDTPHSAGAAEDNLSGNRPFSYDRFVAMVRCFCDASGGVFTAKLFKLLFFADFLAYKELHRSISGSRYRALQHGPVPADYGALMERLLEEDMLSSEIVDFGQCSGTKYTSGPKPPPTDDSLTGSEIKIIQAVTKRFHHMTATEICEASHREEAWKQTAQKKLVSYEWAKQLSIDL